MTAYRAFLLLLALSALGCESGCSSANADSHVGQPATGSTRPAPERVIAPTITASTPGPTAGAPTESAQLGTAQPRADQAGPLYYDFVRHQERGELFSGSTRVLDFGGGRSPQYTLGEWQNSAVSDVSIDGRTVGVLRGASLRVGTTVSASLAANPAGLEWTASIRSARAGRVRLFARGRELGNASLRGGTFETVSLNVPKESLREGENDFVVRTDVPAGALGGVSGTLAIDWMTFEGISLATRIDAVPAMRPASIELDGNWHAAWTLEPPENASLLIETSPSSAPVEVRATVDGAEAHVLGTVRPGSASSLSLGAFRGSIVRIALAPQNGSASITRASVHRAPETGAAATPRTVRNALVYLVDTLRADKLKPINGRSRVQTPGLMRFAENASTFTGAHTQENWTKPSVATLLSSLLPWHHHAITSEAVVPDSVQLLPELLNRHGYTSAAFIANGYVSDRFGFRQGWSSYRNYIREGLRTQSQFVAADVLEWLDRHVGEPGAAARAQEPRPFFLYVHTIDPHVPYRPPAEFLRLYDPNPYSGVVDFRGDGELLEKIKAGRIPLNARDKQHLEALYDGEISYSDVHFNAIIEGLERRGLADDTIVIVTADHGEELFDHGSVGHGHSVHEELLHIPMFVRMPGARGAIRVEDAVGLVDVMPTILDAMGLPIPRDAVGQSMLPLLRKESAGLPRTAVSGFMDGWRTLASGGYKLIQRTPNRWSVFNIATDAGETTDLAPSRPIALRHMRALLGYALNERLASRSPVVDPPSNPRVRRSATPTPVAVDDARPAHNAETTTIDAETEAQLRALGYVGSSRR